MIFLSFFFTLINNKFFYSQLNYNTGFDKLLFFKIHFCNVIWNFRWQMNIYWGRQGNCNASSLLRFTCDFSEYTVKAHLFLFFLLKKKGKKKKFFYFLLKTISNVYIHSHYHHHHDTLFSLKLPLRSILGIENEYT